MTKKTAHNIWHCYIKDGYTKACNWYGKERVEYVLDNIEYV